MTKRSKQLEDAIEQWLKWKHFAYLRISNYRCYKCGAIGNSKAKGWPDFFVYSPFQLAIEAKTGRGKLTADQERVRDLMEDAGIEYIEVRDNIDSLLDWDEKYHES